MVILRVSTIRRLLSGVTDVDDSPAVLELTDEEVVSSKITDS